jgi:hypothetical protein
VNCLTLLLDTVSAAHGTPVADRQGTGEPIMADDLSNRGSRDRDRINVNGDYELRNWSKKFGVSPEELKRAVQHVGDRADAVRQHLFYELRDLSALLMPAKARWSAIPRSRAIALRQFFP